MDQTSTQPFRSVINSAAYHNGVRVADVPIADLGDAWSHSDRFLWVGLYEPSEQVLAHIQEAFGLHDLAIEDAHRAHQRPKLEVYDDSMFIVMRTAKLSEGGEQRIEFGETHVFYGPRYIITIRHGSIKSHLGLRARCESMPKLLAKGEGFVLHTLIDFIVDQYFPVIDALEKELDELEDQIFSGKFVRSVTARIYHLRRDLLAFKQAVIPLLDVTAQLSRMSSDLVPLDTRPLLSRCPRSCEADLRSDRQSTTDVPHGAGKQPGANHRHSERRHQASGRLGRNLSCADDDCGLVRYEFRAYA